jgi:hypothetical protein
MVLLLLTLPAACKPSATESKVNGTAKAVSSADGEVVRDYPQIFCSNVGNLKLRTDVSAQLSRFCLNGAPTSELLKFRSDALQNTSGKQEIVTLLLEHDATTEFSRFIFAWSFHTAVRPFEVKARPIYQYIAKNYQADWMQSTAVSRLRTEDPLDHGLHLWSVDMNYELQVKVTGGITLRNKHKGEFNLYQVQSANEELGFGVEHLIREEDNKDFKQANMINIAMNDGTGFNDGKGGAVVITMVEFEVANQGFPGTAARAIRELVQFLADNMYAELKK